MPVAMIFIALGAAPSLCEKDQLEGTGIRLDLFQTAEEITEGASDVFWQQTVEHVQGMMFSQHFQLKERPCFECWSYDGRLRNLRYRIGLVVMPQDQIWELTWYKLPTM